MTIKLGRLEPEEPGKQPEPHTPQQPQPARDLKIIWKGKRISKLIFPSGKFVEFQEG